MKINISHLIRGIMVISFVFPVISFAHEEGRFSRIGIGNTYWDNKTDEVVPPCRDTNVCTNCHTLAVEKVPNSRFHLILEDFYWDYAKKKMVKACPHHVANKVDKKESKKNCFSCHTTVSSKSNK